MTRHRECATVETKRGSILLARGPAPRAGLGVAALTVDAAVHYRYSIELRGPSD